MEEKKRSRGKRSVGSAEVYFAKKLANNDKKVRDRAVKRLKVWLSSRSRSNSDFSELEIMKLWKGLFYCMWFSDKPLVQEDLAETISNLVHAFDNPELASVFISGFYQIMSREWHGIDRLRLDKFYMISIVIGLLPLCRVRDEFHEWLDVPEQRATNVLIRKFTHECLKMLKMAHWKEDAVRAFVSALRKGPANYKDQKFADGIRSFVVEIIIEELKKIMDEKPIKSDVAFLLMEPFFELAAHTNSLLVTQSLKVNILERILTRSSLDSDPDDVNQYETTNRILEIDYQSVADRLFELASDKVVHSKNRKMLLNFIKRYREAAKDYNKETNRHEDEAEIGKVNLASNSSKKGRKRSHEELQPEGDDMSEVNHTSTKKKRKKKYTNETNENSSDKPDGPAVTDVNTNSVELEKSISCEQEKKKRNKMKRKSKGTENNLSAVNGNCVEPGTVEEGVSNKDASLNKGTALNEEITSSQETILGNGEILNKEILLSNSVLSDKNFGKNKSFSPLSDQDYDVEAEEPDFSDVTRTLDFGDAFEEQTVENGDKIISQNSKKKSKKRKSNLTKVKPPPETLESIKTDMQGDAEVDPENKPFAKFVKTPPPAAFFRRRTVQGIQGETNSEPPNKVSSAKQLKVPKSEPKKTVKFQLPNNAAGGSKMKSPGLPFRPQQKPEKSVLKKSSKITPKWKAAISKASPRPKASDYF